MLRIRLFRVGKKNQPFFKIVVTDKRKPPRAGRFVEQVGFYNPLRKEKGLKAERIKYWLSVGAKPSATVHNLLVSEKMFAEPRSSHEGQKISKHKKSKKQAKEELKGDVLIEKKLSEEKPIDKEQVEEKPMVDEKVS